MLQPIRAKKHRLPLAAYRGQKSTSFTACIAGRKRAFQTTEVALPIIETLRAVTVKHRCTALVYCFMPDHLHLILRGLTDDANAKTAMDSFKYESGLWFSRNSPQFEWQREYYDHIIRSSEDLRRQICYVAENPVRAGLSEGILEYPFTGSDVGPIAEMLLDLEFDQKFGYGG